MAFTTMLNVSFWGGHKLALPDAVHQETQRLLPFLTSVSLKVSMQRGHCWRHMPKPHDKGELPRAVTLGELKVCLSMPCACKAFLKKRELPALFCTTGQTLSPANAPCFTAHTVTPAMKLTIPHSTDEHSTCVHALTRILAHSGTLIEENSRTRILVHSLKKPSCPSKS
jgi:hypothetical protein